MKIATVRHASDTHRQTDRQKDARDLYSVQCYAIAMGQIISLKTVGICSQLIPQAVTMKPAMTEKNIENAYKLKTKNKHIAVTVVKFRVM